MTKKRRKNRQRVKPTRSGTILMGISFAMLIAAMNYSNNMGYILCFLTTSLLMVSFLYTQINLKGLEIRNVRIHPVFAGESLQLTFELNNTSQMLRLAIYANDFSGPFSVSPRDCTTAKIGISAPRRGKFVLPGIFLWTVYPMGVFKAQLYIPINKIYFVYPQPKGARQWPDWESHEEEQSEGFYNRGGDDFIGHKPWRPGESMHHIDWKAVARGRPMSIKEFTGGGTDQLWFDWDKLSGMGIETRLSQLTRWILEAEQEGHEFGLRIPDKTIPVDCSPGHTTKCLETLAVFRQVS